MTDPTEPAPSLRIGQLEDGAQARVEAVVRAATAPLRSPLLNQECVYWDVRRGLGHQPERHEASLFWLEDETGRVLVRGDALEVDVRARLTQEILTTLEADHQALSSALTEIKQELKRGAAGEQAKRLHAKRAELARVVTFLLAVRAQARGKLHLGGATLAEQATWIEKNAPKERPTEGAATIGMAVDRYEVVLAPGDRVVAEGVVTTEPVPSGIAAGGGYRDLPTARVLGPGPSGVVRVIGVGASRPVSASEVRGTSGGPASKRDARGGGSASTPSRVFERAMVGAVGVAGVIAGVLWWLYGR